MISPVGKRGDYICAACGIDDLSTSFIAVMKSIENESVLNPRENDKKNVGQIDVPTRNIS